MFQRRFLNDDIRSAFRDDFRNVGRVDPVAARALSFLARERQAVLKPLHEAQSKGIHRLDAAEIQSARARLQEATHNFSRPALLQEYLPGIAQGETRVWFVDGQILAVARKFPLQGDFRVQIDQGSRIEKAELDAAGKKAAAWAARLLRKWKVRLAAVDLIDGKITDFNVTSPGLIVQMEAALGRELAPAVIRTLSK
jgi:glutathione synthase